MFLGISILITYMGRIIGGVPLFMSDSFKMLCIKMSNYGCWISIYFRLIYKVNKYAAFSRLITHLYVQSAIHK